MQDIIEKLYQDFQTCDKVIPAKDIAEFIIVFFEYLMNEATSPEINEAKNLLGEESFFETMGVVVQQLLLNLYTTMSFTDEHDVRAYLDKLFGTDEMSEGDA